jgi:hypothetical protein
MRFFCRELDQLNTPAIRRAISSRAREIGLLRRLLSVAVSRDQQAQFLVRRTARSISSDHQAQEATTDAR